ncbi:MAG TPA: peptidase domain-containing ABC transporter [Longimicrobium sp.]|jgi:ATP-binding cassette subfamily B protein
MNLPWFRRIPRVKQHDRRDCGAACLHSIARSYGHHVSIARIRQLASTDLQGTNMLGLVEGAGRLGFLARGVRATPEALATLPLPAVAHVVLPSGLHHFVVVYRVRKRHVVYMDPGDGRVHTVPHEEFRGRWSGVLLILAPGEAFTPAADAGTAGARFQALVRPHRAVLAQALFGAAVYTVLGLSMSIYVQKLVDGVLLDGNRGLLNLMSVGMLLILALQLFVGASRGILTLQTGQKIDGALILGYHKHLLSLPQQFFDTMRAGEIVSRIGDAVKIRAFINEAALDMVLNVFIVIFSIALMFVYSPPLALLALGVVPFYASIYVMMNRVNRARQRRLMERGAELQAQLVESLSSVSTIKRFGLEWFANVKTESRFVRMLREVYGAAVAGMASGLATEVVSRTFTILLLWMGAGLVIDRELTPGQLMSCYALLGYFTGPAARLIGANRTIQDALIAADRLFEIMELEREETGSRAELTREMVGDVRFRGVSFRYGTRKRVFEELDVTFPRGRMTAVVGESGSGKTSLAALLQGLYPLEKGQVFIGDLEVRHISNESLRALVAAVPQQIDLFSGTLLENIAIGDFEPDVRRVAALGRMLGISEFVDELPGGYGAEIGPNGSTLSGGQRQRVAIARALYRDPEILILDEATSALDPVSERFVKAAVEQLKGEGKTVIVIAHRLSTVMSADNIIVLDRGRVVEEGTHAALMAAEGAYHRLWRMQFPAAEHAGSAAPR